MLATRTALVNAGDRVQAGDGRHAWALGRGVHDIAPCEDPRQMTRVGRLRGQIWVHQRDTA
jgi:hypothetical protein